MASNLANVSYIINYYHFPTAYITGGELPPVSLTLANAPVGGYMYIYNDNGVTLGSSGTIYSLYIENNNGGGGNNNVQGGNVLNPNGYTLQLVGNGANGYTIYNYAQSYAGPYGINAGTATGSLQTSTLSFIGNTPQNIYLGNQNFNSVYTAPNIIVSNSSLNTGVIAV